MTTKAILAAAMLAAATADHDPDVPYPEGFRRWTHIKSSINTKANDPRAGIHHIYANELALKGYETGKFADGSVIAFDLLAVSTENGTTKEGARKLVDVMRKDSQRYAATGGWGFEEFMGDSRTPVLKEKAVAACYTCHTSRKENDLVFSSLRP
jgi:hypothetical protein